MRTVIIKIFKPFKKALPLFLVQILKIVYYKILFYRIDGYWLATKRDFRFFIPNLDASDLVEIDKFKTFYERYFKVELNDVVLDVGSCLGSFSVCASCATGNKGLVVSIEPAPENFFFLKKNVSTLKNVVIINKCISNFKGEATLYLSDLQTHSLVKYTTNSVKIPTDTLDNLASALKLDKVDFIKINVEGAELEVLEGANRVLKMAKKVVVGCLHHIRDGKPTYLRVKELLKKHGFDVLVAPNKIVCARKGENE